MRHILFVDVTDVYGDLGEPQRSLYSAVGTLFYWGTADNDVGRQRKRAIFVFPRKLKGDEKAGFMTFYDRGHSGLGEEYLEVSAEELRPH